MPPPVSGVIVFKPVSQNPSASAAVALSLESNHCDTQLSRLLRDGWAIEKQDEATVSLFKFKGEIRKTMVHRRPKKK
jgi:hypothetical protein